jgi:tetratricopeptide (TPR) repeat protein
MKLRRCFPIHQLLFLLTASLLTGHDAAAQDRIVKTDGSTQDVKIVGVSGSAVQVQVGAGTVGVPLSSIAQITMQPPADFTAATTAVEAKDYGTALASAKSVATKFRGLPTDWAQQATAMVGDIYVALNDLTKAEAAYQDFQKTYPNAGSTQTDVGLARIAFSKKDYATVKQKLDPIKTQALTLKAVPANLAPAYSKAFYLLGQAEEAQGDYSNALQDYLRTVTLFYHDRIAAASAQEKADALRKSQLIAVP